MPVNPKTGAPYPEPETEENSTEARTVNGEDGKTSAYGKRKAKSVGTFNIGNFRSQIDGLGGVARTTLYRAEIIIPQALRGSTGKITTETLTFLVASINFPGLRLTTHPVQRYGIGPAEDMPTGVVTGSCLMNILGDAEGNVLRFLRAWTRGTVEYQSATGGTMPNEMFPSMKPFHVNYKQNIETQITVVLYDSAGNQIYKVAMTKAFPTDISSLYLAWSNTDQVMYIPVSFSYFDLAFEDAGDYKKGEQQSQSELSVMERIYSGGAALQSVANYFSPTSNLAEVLNGVNNTVAGIKQLGKLFGN